MEKLNTKLKGYFVTLGPVIAPGVAKHLVPRRQHMPWLRLAISNGCLANICLQHTLVSTVSVYNFAVNAVQLFAVSIMEKCMELRWDA